MKFLIKITILFLCLSTLTIFGQQNSFNSSDILMSIKKLNSVGSVLYIAAHPDDENTRLLAYLSKEKKIRTGYLSLTRGDGGQNLIGNEQGEMLGLIRTQELLEARKVDGAEQFFSRAFDFGYSKNPEETFNFWKKDSILSDVVWVIRNFKPDIIICRFPTTGEGGHGHHTASAILAKEAFEAATDPTKFSSQLKYTSVWKTNHIFWNTFNFGSTNTTSENQIKMDVGVFNPLLGKSYGELAAESRTMHKSQGFGSAKTRGNIMEYFKQLDKDSVKSIFENNPLDWSRFKGTEKLISTINATIDKFNPEHPENSISALIDILKELKSINNSDLTFEHYKKIKIKEIENTILECSGFWAEATNNDYSICKKSNVNFTVQLINRRNTKIKLEKIIFNNNVDSIVNKDLKENELVTIKHNEIFIGNTENSQPYWLTEKPVEGLFFVKSQMQIGQAQNPPALKVELIVDINNTIIKTERELIFKSTDPVKGEIYRPIEILPPANINFSENFYLFDSETPKKIKCIIKANKKNINGKLVLKANQDWKVNLKKSEFNLENKGDEIILEAEVSPGKSQSNLDAYIIIDSLEYNKSIFRINYDHIPSQFLFTKSTAKLLKSDLKSELKQIGYIDGAGDDIPKCLEQLGYTVTKISDEYLMQGDLSIFKTIITGVRAYNTNSKLQNVYPKLMDYVKNGGNLIVQYNTNNRIGPLVAKIGPYPFNITRDRVTDEKSKVDFVLKDHPILNYPNKIESSDFDNWIQERGIYFADELDSNYVSILEMNDPNEKKLKGSLITAKYGKGNFVYTGISFFRELPAGVVGAYKLFINLINIPKNK